MKNNSPEKTMQKPIRNYTKEKLVEAAAPQTIQLLSAEVIHRIAAGEIVDRPASVLKELLENSVDANSQNIKVTLIEGGLRLIKVEDDGVGMSPADLKVCLQRHATSKIRKVEDLDHIFSLGFRGEALAAASSVSRLKIESKTQHEEFAFQIESTGSSEKTEPTLATRISCGTTVSVADLFFNVPARLKFLKKANSELSECLEVFKSIALSNAQISFSIQWLDAKGEIKGFDDFPTETLIQRFSRISQIEGIEPWFLELANPAPGVTNLRLLVFPPPHVSHQQKSVRLSVNGRWVLDKRLPFAAREAFLGLIEVGAFPKMWVDIYVEPEKIDVNIHPQKKEIRWPTDFSLAGTVYKKLRDLIVEKTSQREQTIFQTPILQSATQLDLDSYPAQIPKSNFSTAATKSPEPGTGSGQINQKFDPFIEASRSMSPNLGDPPFGFESLRVIGEVGASWLICESHLGLVIIDQHAAHERVEFDRYMKNVNLLRTAPLAVPLLLDLPIGVQGQAAAVESVLKELGFEFSDYSQRSDSQIEILAMPSCDRKLNWKKIFDGIFNELTDGNGSENLLHEIKVQVASSLACHGSVRRGQRLAVEEIQELLKQMSQVAWGAFCPHGRPVWKLIRHIDIENFFHR